MKGQHSFGIGTLTSREVHLDWHVWVFFAHFFIWCARHAHSAADYCMAESGSEMHIEKRKHRYKE